MRNHNLAPYIFFLLITLACSPSQQNPDNSTGELDTDVYEHPPELSVITQPTLTLLSFHSSSNLPDHEVESLFDDDPETHWQTALNTGPNECISFSIIGEGAWIQQLTLEPLIADQTIPFDEVSLYINNQLFAEGERFTLQIDTLVKRVDICFKVFKPLIFNKFELEKEAISFGFFPEEANIGLKSLQLFNAEGQAFKVSTPKKIKGRIAPSSNLNPLAMYHAGRLFDGRPHHAWIEGSEGSGSGDSILFQLDTTTCISKIAVWNGLQSTEEQFFANARIKTFHFKPFKDTSTVVFQLPDLFQPSEIYLRKDSAINWLLQIIDIYPGNNTRDLAISELLFFDCDNAPFIIESGLTEQFQNEILSQAEGTILEDILGKYIFNEIRSTEDDSYVQKSITLHPDGVFTTMYQKNDENQVLQPGFIAQGYWNILEVNNQLARLRLSARLLHHQDPLNPEINAHLEEELVIKPQIIEGTKILGKFYTE